MGRNSLRLLNVSIETSDGHRRRFLPGSPQPVEVVANVPLHGRSFCLTSFSQKNHLSLSNEGPSSPPHETVALSPLGTSQHNATATSDRKRLGPSRIFDVSSQGRPTGLASQHRPLQSHQQLSPIEERREFVSSCTYPKHQHCELSDTCQPLPDDRRHTPAMSRPKYPRAVFPLKRLSALVSPPNSCHATKSVHERTTSAYLPTHAQPEFAEFAPDPSSIIGSSTSSCSGVWDPWPAQYPSCVLYNVAVQMQRLAFFCVWLQHSRASFPS